MKKEVVPDTTGITINGEPLDGFLKDHEQPVSKEVIAVHQDTIKEIKRYNKPITRKIKPSIEDLKPGKVIKYTKEMILMETLNKHYEARLQETTQEAQSTTPNTKKLVFGAICQKDFLKASEITEKIETLIGKPLPTNAVSNIFYDAWKPKAPRPIVAFIEIQKGGVRKGRLYRLNPHVAKLTLDNIFELAKAKTQSNFSLRDAVMAVPELGVAVESFNKLSKPDTVPAPKKKTVEQPAAKKKTAPVKSAAPIAGIPQEVNVNINVNFGPFRITFGIDK